MLWFYLIITSLTCAIVAGTLKHLIKNTVLFALSTVTAVTISIVLTRQYVEPHYKAWVFETNIKEEDPIFSILAYKSPVEFNSYILNVKKSILRDGSEHEVIYYTSNFLNTELLKFSQNASNLSLYDYAVTTVNFYTKLYNTDPILVLNMEFPGIYYQNTNYQKLDRASIGFISTILTAKRDIIKSAIDNPQPKMSKENVERAKLVLRNIFRTLSEEYGSRDVINTFNRPNELSLNKKVAAKIIIQFYQEIINHGEDDAGIVIKYIFSMQT